MTEREALLRAVCENPDEDTPRLVFADWLQENGDEERAEFIRLQIELVGMRDGKAKQKKQAREKELLKAHQVDWTAPLKEFEGNRTGDYYVFRRGFVEAIASDGEIMVEEGDRVFALAPIREIVFADEEEYGELAKCKWLLKLHTLDLKGSGLSHHFDPTPLIRSRYLANLTALCLAGEDDNGHLDMAGVEALVSSKYLGKVEELDLSGNWLNQFDRNTVITLLRAENLPALRRLLMRGVGLDEVDAAVIAQSAWLSKLKQLNLSRNTIRAPGMMSLAKSRHLAGLELLDLRDNLEPLPDSVRQSLKDRFGDRVLL